MRAGPLVALVGRDLRRSLRTFSVAALGIVAGVAVLAFFLALSEGMRAVVLGRIFPIDRVEVIPPESSVGSVLSLLGGGGPPGVDEAQVQALRAVPGVREVSPRMRFAFPSSGRGGRAIFGRDVGAGEIPADGAEAAVVLRDLPAGTDFSDPAGRSSGRPCAAATDCGDGEMCSYPEIPRANGPVVQGRCELPIPVVVSPYLVEIFNGTIAPAHNLPRVGDLLLRRATGLVLEWDLGRAGLGGARQGTPRRTYARLVGVSRHAMDLGVTVPLDVARRLNREFAGEAAAARYSSVVVYLRDPGAMTDVSAAVRAQGLEVRTNGAEQMGLLVKAITWILALASIVTVLVASLNIAHAFLSLIAERRGEIGLMRALGAKRADIATMIVAQAAAVGALSTSAGLALSFAAASVAERYARTSLPAFPFKPDVWFVFAPRAMAGVFAFGVLACVVASLVPAIRASRVEPAEALAGGV